MSYLASNLTGKTVDGWIVGKKISKVDSTGGAFSSGYEVINASGKKAFMKAINLGYAIRMFGGSTRSLTDLINQITSDFRYERDLLELCGSHRMNRIVVAIASGEYYDASDPYFVPYLVFELCSEGDIRRHTQMKNPGLAWRLRVFHGVCVGLMQLHNKDIAHQDLKPSNVLVFEGDNSKIADLGRSTTKLPSAKFASDGHAGDLGYTPIELQYQHYEANWDVRRKGADLYMLGGILAFLAANVHIFGLVLTKIPLPYHPRYWKGGFQNALPAVKTATHSSITEIVEIMPDVLREDLRHLLTWLCEPEPSKRGHPSTLNRVSGNRFSLERIVSAADRLATKAKLLPK